MCGVCGWECGDCLFEPKPDLCVCIWVLVREGEPDAEAEGRESVAIAEVSGDMNAKENTFPPFPEPAEVGYALG
jgi:hypothetical protein